MQTNLNNRTTSGLACHIVKLLSENYYPRLCTWRIAMHSDFSSKHSLLNGKEGNKMGANYLFLGHKTLGVNCAAWYSETNASIRYDFFFLTNRPVFLLHLSELLSVIYNWNTFICKTESKYILKQFTIIKNFTDVAVGLKWFKDYVVAFIPRKFNLTILDRAGPASWASAFGKRHVNHHFTTGSQISVSVASLLLLSYSLLVLDTHRLM